LIPTSLGNFICFPLFSYPVTTPRREYLTYYVKVPFAGVSSFFRTSDFEAAV
jgi:hypothetical protein